MAGDDDEKRYEPTLGEPGSAPPVPPAPFAAASWNDAEQAYIYEVRRGDTLLGISGRTSTDFRNAVNTVAPQVDSTWDLAQAIAHVNNIGFNSTLSIGQALRFPGPTAQAELADFSPYSVPRLPPGVTASVGDDGRVRGTFTMPARTPPVVVAHNDGGRGNDN